MGMLMALVAQANSITLTVNGTDSDGPVSAVAVVTPGAGEVTITLTDLLANPQSAGQLISGLNFDITDVTGVNSVSGSGELVTITGGGPASPTGSTSLTHWAATLSGSTVTLTTLSGGQPNQMIIGPADSSGKYSAANASIENFNPSVLNTATFTIFLNGSVTAASTISDIQIQFGTGPEATLPNTPSVPDGGSTVALLGFALCGIGLVGRKLRIS
jgi:hypothetical protein